MMIKYPDVLGLNFPQEINYAPYLMRKSLALSVTDGAFGVTIFSSLFTLTQSARGLKKRES